MARLSLSEQQLRLNSLVSGFSKSVFFLVGAAFLLSIFIPAEEFPLARIAGYFLVASPFLRSLWIGLSALQIAQKRLFWASLINLSLLLIIILINYLSL